MISVTAVFYTNFYIFTTTNQHLSLGGNFSYGFLQKLTLLQTLSPAAFPAETS